jgi:hypothetical protein
LPLAEASLFAFAKKCECVGSVFNRVARSSSQIFCWRFFAE